jgi:hypothetical protein
MLFHDAFLFPNWVPIHISSSGKGLASPVFEPGINKGKKLNSWPSVKALTVTSVNGSIQTKAGSLKQTYVKLSKSADL